MPTPSDASPGLHLQRTRERRTEVDALTARLGGPVGLAGVLADLNRTATVGSVPALAASWGFRWDAQDDGSRRWWPQGITCSGDAAAHDAAVDGAVTDGAVDGRRVLLTSAYAKERDGVGMGARISVVDVTDPGRVRYRHVLLVDAGLSDDELVLRPVKVHAGGLTWHGGHLHVAGTLRGLSSFRLADICAVPAGGDPRRLGPGPNGSVDAFGYRYLLPLRFSYEGRAGEGAEPMRYSFVSLDRSTSPPALVAGEYAPRRAAGGTRLARYGIEKATSLPGTEPGAGAGTDLVRALAVENGVRQMQGACVVDGRHYVTTSAGGYRRGSLWVGDPGCLRRYGGVLPIGPEDLTYWPETDELWSLSEYPHHRFVFAMDRSRFT